MTHSSLPHDHAQRMERALLALDGLSVGDALGSQFFVPVNRDKLEFHERPTPSDDEPWPWTDDTAMALDIVTILHRHGRIMQDELATTFAQRFQRESFRGYGPGAIRLLASIVGGEDWRVASKNLFGGMGSFGNGTAMRIAPLAAYFADDIPRLVDEARLSCEVTHAHPDGIAGGIAIAVAGAFAWQNRDRADDPTLTARFFETVLAHTPECDTRIGIAHASIVETSLDVRSASQLLGNGRRVTCQDTVPFCLWVIAKHFNDFSAAMWTTIHAFGDIDTNAAIVGGVVSLACGPLGIPREWLAARERLDVVLD